MNKRKILLIFKVSMCILLIQHLTFIYIGIPMLKDKILLELPSETDNVYNSAFVRGYYSSDCHVGDPPNHFELNLDSQSDFIKQKLNVSNLYFADINTSTWDDPTISQYDLYYQAFVSAPSILTLYDLYSCSLDEYLDFPNNNRQQSSKKYQWLLFWWI